MKRLYIGDKDVSGIMKLDDNFVYVPFPKPFEIEYLIVAGGGGGGYSQIFPDGPLGGGGGAGGMITGSMMVEIGYSSSAIIGNGGSGGTVSKAPGQGNNTTFISKTALGGGRAGNWGGSIYAGANGGSGGGAAASPNPYSGGLGLQPTSTDGGFGNNGGSNSGAPTENGGGGGGAGSAAKTGFDDKGKGGDGVVWVDGTNYARGGGLNNPPAINGNGGNPGNNTTGNGTAGGKGIVKLRYAGQPKATGGTITQSGGYTYHTFTSADTFEVFSSFDVN